ncbi:MAG TPA: Ada metal-binding domain-containing protein [Candidatus Paceibacterota bacterium]|nr:Ada metal-binding domain-containing protein [Candidatus Paceibacterota bacterium]
MNGVTIQAFLAHCKGLLEDGVGQWGLVLLVFLVGIGAYGLGRLSALEEVKPPVSVAQAPQEADIPALPPGGFVVASRTGSVYYLPWCSGAQKIAAGNQVWFGSEAAAQKAGYAPSKTCKGL